MNHPCTTLYALSNQPILGTTEGTCRITGQHSKGILFERWVRNTFTDFPNLKPGNIISNEAALCFEEQSEYLQKLTGKDKPQRFRNYSHIVLNGKWYVKNKGQKEDILKLMLQIPEICVIAESGQKHIFFKNVPGTWQLEEITIQPDNLLFKTIHSVIHELSNDFSNDEIKSGQYLQHRIMKSGIAQWQQNEMNLKKYRGSAMFDLALFFSKIKINKYE